MSKIFKGRRYASAEGMVVWTVHAWRYGSTENHSYLVGVYSKPRHAMVAAETEERHRGGKYICEVIEFVLDRGREASDDFDRPVIKPLEVRP